jgi:hypothetical protein
MKSSSLLLLIPVFGALAAEPAPLSCEQAGRTDTCASYSELQTDQTVLRAALQHFAERTDTSSMNENGVLLIAARSMPVDARQADSVTAEPFENANCKNRQSFRDSLLERNTRERRVAGFVGKSSRWRVVSGDDEPALPIGVSADDVKTSLRLSFPAYRPHGRAALVRFLFTWSIHSAEAIYMLEQHGNGWRVSCSDLFFYL